MVKLPDAHLHQGLAATGSEPIEVVTDKAVTDKAVTDKAVTDKAVTDKAVTDKAVTDKAVTDKAATYPGVLDEILSGPPYHRQACEQRHRDPLIQLSSVVTSIHLCEDLLWTG